MLPFLYGPVALRAQSVNELVRLLARTFPEVKAKSSNPATIMIHDGNWRGMHLLVDDRSQPMQFKSCYLEIPSFASKLLLFAISIVLFSLTVTVVGSMLIGEFMPAVAGVGGVAGFVMYSVLKKIVLFRVKKNWGPVVKPVLEQLWELPKDAPAEVIAPVA